MALFHPLQIERITKPTKDSAAITFCIPSSLKDDFSYTQGQYVTLKSTIDGEEVRRSYSICSSPLSNELTVAIKKLQGGKFSTFANEKLKKGDLLDVMPPAGKFFVPLHNEHQKSYVAFASGSGITPMLSIIETTLLVEEKSEFILFYGNRRAASIMFHEKLEALKNQFMGRFSIYHILSKERQESDLFYGRIDAPKIDAFSSTFFDPETIDDYFICGPEEMMLAIQGQLIKQGVPKDKIHFELFSSGSKGSEDKKREATSSQSEITIIYDGNKMSFPYDSELSILDVAYQYGAALPYACKAGVCSTCVCKLEKGK
ncbi:MAG: ferredoxin--NADP reductase, partial [Bacteroidota bacterium]